MYYAKTNRIAFNKKCYLTSSASDPKTKLKYPCIGKTFFFTPNFKNSSHGTLTRRLQFKLHPFTMMGKLISHAKEKPPSFNNLYCFINHSP
ncbi:hypothetical protein HOT39_gp85 [Escherichia phage LL5]|uniref:Uncharacterized protein n=1 Tax=Escherichia phage LL5 TaxID=2233992 RepID=A0A2Z4Q2Y7_9CAUD|nr:hypothetical protein HOT39_gp85 [Escherichia phage LL5]AWY04387.1 hypothetical protein CPT_LL5_85 [Escherichia phage LL5]